MSLTQRAVALVVALVVVVGVVLLALRPPGPVAEAPDATTSPIATASASPSAAATQSVPTSPEPMQLTEEETLAILAEIERAVEDIRGLPPADVPPADIISREELVEELRRVFDEEYPPEERERDNIALRALGLLEPGQDVAELQLQLLGDQVLGFYDDTEQRMVVVTDTGLGAEAKITYAHEYTHALQDAAFGLDTLETDAVGEDDRGLARTALIEGDATLTMIAWAYENLSQQELVELGQVPVPDANDVPSWMLAQIEFPYSAGSLWAAQLALDPAASDPSAADFTAIDAAYANPPDSTEQIIDIEKWHAREMPIAVSVPDLAVALGDGWEEVDTTPVGEASIRIMLEYLGVTPPEAAEASGGWGGDRLVVASGPDDSFALVWRLAWDTPIDADQFIAAYQVAAEALPFPASVRELPGGEVLVVHASSQQVHDEALAAAH